MIPVILRGVPMHKTYRRNGSHEAGAPGFEIFNWPSE
jgi:hypothetical protein